MLYLNLIHVIASSPQTVFVPFGIPYNFSLRADVILSNRKWDKWDFSVRIYVNLGRS